MVEQSPSTSNEVLLAFKYLVGIASFDYATEKVQKVVARIVAAATIFFCSRFEHCYGLLSGELSS